MPTDSLTVRAINIEELRQALTDAPTDTFRFVKQALFRFARRTARKTKSGYLHGAPGITGGPWARVKDKNIRGFTTGADLAGLKAVTKASRIVRTHIEGAVITPKQAGFLYLSRKTGVKGKGHIFARVKAVVIPARIPFEALWRAEIPKAGDDVADAMQRAVALAVARRLKTITSAVERLAGF